MATVRGTFDLNSKPASSALRDLRAEGDKTELTFKNVGKALDGVGTTKQREQVRLYQNAIKALGKQWEQTATKADAAWDAMEKKTIDSTAVQSAAIDSLQDRVDELGRSRPTIDVNTHGIDEALAQVELLHKRVNALGRERATPSVGIGGGGFGGGAPGGGGGPPSHGGLFGKGLNVPFAGSIPYPLIAGALGAAPPLLGSATGVLGSATAGALGAGAIGVAGYGTLAAGVGSIAAVAIPAVKGLKETYKAMQSYNMAVKENGKNSTQAHTALSKLNAVLGAAPKGTRGVINQEQRLTSRFTRLTKPAQSSFMGSIGNLLGAGNKLTPQLAGIENPLLAGVQKQSGRFSNFLTSKTSRSFIGSAGASAISTLPEAEDILQNVLATLMNISRASMPFFKEAVRFLDSWTKGWRSSTGEIGKTRKTIGGMVEQLKLWVRLGGAAFDLVKDLFKSSTPSGGGLVGSLTKQLDKWDEWINKNPKKVRAFFAEAAEQTEKIASALGNIAGVLWRVGRLLTPLLTQLSQFVGFLDSAGLLSNGGLSLLLAGGAGIRNAIGGARSRILGTGAQAAEAGVGSSATEGLVVAGALGGGVARKAEGGILSRTAAGARGLFGRVGSAYRSAGRIPVVGAGGTMAAEADAGLLGETTFSRTAGLMGAGRVAAGSVLPEAAGLGGSFLRGAGARFLPIAALMGGLSAASFPGGIRGRAGAFLSGISGGLYPEPKTDAEKEDEGTRHAQMVANYYAEKYGNTPKGIGRQILATRRKRNRLLVPAEHGGFLTTNANPFSSEFGNEPKSVSGTDRKEFEALGKQLDQLRTAKKEEEASRRGKREERGLTVGSQLQGAFNIRKAKEGGVAALGQAAPEVLGKIKHLGKAGGLALAANVLEWTRVAKQQNPKLKGQYEELVEQITHQFAAMGKHIKIINGEIYEGSAREWAQIQKGMVNPIEQAREEMSKSFTAIQREAVDVLRAMGYSPGQARNLVQSQEQGHPTKALSQENASQHNHGQTVISPNNIGPQPKGARGLRIPGVGNTDNVPIGGSTGIGAPGELIVNQHTEARANRLLGPLGTTLERLQRSETRAHSSPLGQLYGGRQGLMSGRGRRRFARGGRVILDSGVNMSYGQEPIIKRDLSGLSSELGQPVYVISGYRSPAHSVEVGGFADDPHTRGEAADIGVGSPSLSSMFGVSEAALKAVGLYRPFYPADPHEVNHVQLLAGGAVGKLAGRVGGGAFKGGRRGGGGGQSIHLKRRHSGIGGVGGALADAGSNTYASALEKKVNKKLGGMGGGYSGPLAAAHGSRSSVERQIAKILFQHGANKIGAAGIIGNAYRESGMDPTAEGTGGGGLWGFTAGAISLANLKLAGGKNWGNPAFQTRFMLAHGGQGLIPALNRSASPEAAAALFMNEWERPGIPAQSDREAGARVAFSQGYKLGGRLPRFAGFFRHGGSFVTRGPTNFVAGEGGAPERVRVEPHRPRRISSSRRGRGGRPIEIKFGDVHVRSEADIKKLVAEVEKKLIAALAEDDGVDDEEVSG